MFLVPALVLIVCVILHAQFPVINGQCPTGKDLHRLGKTRFYIIQNVNKRKMYYVNQTMAYLECRKHKLELAKIKNMLTLAIAARPLEKFAFKHKLKDTFYWLDAKYDPGKQLYYWGEKKQDGEVKFSNFYHRNQRPTGVNAHVDSNHKLQLNSGKEQCLQVSLPYFGPSDSGANGRIYGHQTMLDERHCESSKTRHAMCEAGAECNSKSDDAFILTEDKKNYFEKGNWIFGDRRFIVNWKYRTREENKKYCNDRGLEVFVPYDDSTVVTALIPFLKMWSREITTSHFWTSMKWFTNGSFVRPDGSIHLTAAVNHNGFTEGSQIGGRSSKLDKEFCVSFLHTYEFKTQMPCTDPNSTNSKCSWSYLEYVPTNCNNYFATICQHKDFQNRKIVWKSEYVKNVDLALNETATTRFGSNSLNGYVRSRYKQTFGGLVCPPGHRMVRDNNKEWYKKPTTLDFPYDYQETYWVVDSEGFKKTNTSMCTVSEPGDAAGFTRKLNKVKCVSWYFYLCEKIAPAPIVPWNGRVNRAEPMKWKEGPQRRPYPIRK